MVIPFPVRKTAQARLAAVRAPQQQSHSFGYALSLSAGLSLMLWAGVAALIRL